MRKLIGSSLLAAALVALPAAAFAQMHAGAKHEFGVDLGIVYSKASGGTGLTGIGWPFGDVRVGFVGRSKMMFEARSTFLLLSGGGATVYQLDIGPNLLWSLSPGGHNKGLYVTAGAAATLADVGATSGFGASVNGGVGTRSPYGSGAWRLEAFFRYDLKSADIGRPVNVVNIGLRAGISLWH